MKLHIKEYARRIKKYSASIENQAILLDQPWMLQSNHNKCIYIFRKENNQLLISINGQVEKAIWDFIPSMKSLVIERNGNTILYNQAFFDDSLMILQKDGTEEYLLFANQNKIETTIENLLKNVEKKYLLVSNNNKSNIIFRELENGEVLQIYSKKGSKFPQIGMEASINEKKISGKYLIQRNRKYRYYYIEDGVITNITFLSEETCIDGQILSIEKNQLGCLFKGDIVKTNGSLAPTGVYKLGLFRHIKVQNGVIDSITVQIL